MSSGSSKLVRQPAMRPCKAAPSRKGTGAAACAAYSAVDVESWEDEEETRESLSEVSEGGGEDEGMLGGSQSDGEELYEEPYREEGLTGGRTRAYGGGSGYEVDEDEVNLWLGSWRQALKDGTHDRGALSAAEWLRQYEDDA